MIAILALLVAGEAAWVPHAELFRNPEACVERLRELAEAARDGRHDAVEGPYDIAGGDVRIHTVKAEGRGHRIHEYRCLSDRMSSRTWHHSMEDAEEEFTVEAMARKAEWLKKRAGEQ